MKDRYGANKTDRNTYEKNLLDYIKTRNMEHIVYLKNNIEELIRLKQITKVKIEYLIKYFERFLVVYK